MTQMKLHWFNMIQLNTISQNIYMINPIRVPSSFAQVVWTGDDEPGGVPGDDYFETCVSTILVELWYKICVSTTSVQLALFFISLSLNTLPTPTCRRYVSVYNMFIWMWDILRLNLYGMKMKMYKYIHHWWVVYCLLF